MEAPQIRDVVVRFRDTRMGIIEIRNAARLARVLGCSLGVIAPNVDPERATRETEAIRDRIRDIVGNGGLIIEIRSDSASDPIPFPPQTLIVDAEFARTRRDATVLAIGEADFRIDDRAPLYVPTGDGDSGIAAARFAVMLAARLEKPIVFYHTTWREPTCTSTDPVDHMCAAAKTVLHVAKLAAVAAQISHQVVIEMASDITGGVVRTALRANASCIVVARGGRTGKGSYVDQLLMQSPLPVLIVNPNHSSEVQP